MQILLLQSLILFIRQGLADRLLFNFIPAQPITRDGLGGFMVRRWDGWPSECSKKIDFSRILGHNGPNKFEQAVALYGPRKFRVLSL